METFRIDRIGGQGDGIAETPSGPVFASLTLPGETVRGEVRDGRLETVEIVTPNAATAKATSLVTGRRGQILGYAGRPDWQGWDVLSALIPESEMQDLIVELRSLTAGVGSYTARFDHWAELSGRPAEQVLSAS